MGWGGVMRGKLCVPLRKVLVESKLGNSSYNTNEVNSDPISFEISTFVIVKAVKYKFMENREKLSARKDTKSNMKTFVS